jgi:hypothetical protein
MFVSKSDVKVDKLRTLTGEIIHHQVNLNVYNSIMDQVLYKLWTQMAIRNITDSIFGTIINLERNKL